MTTLDYAKPTPVQRRWLRSALLALGAFGALAAIILVASWLMTWHTLGAPKVAVLDFDSARWQAASHPDASHNSVRLRMADSFLARQQPLGKSRDQIVALLGKPDDTPYFRNYDMVYYLGPERGPISIDSEWLVIKLTNGIVTEARLVTD